MESEKLKVFDKTGKLLGIKTRGEVHEKGLWHETFHCWFVQREREKDYVYFQLRSNRKKDYPNLLDITVAGHLLAEETMEDGVREIQEEVGLDVAFEELIPMGISKYIVRRGEDFIDKELANVFLFYFDGSFHDFELQDEEVSGIVRVEMESFYPFALGVRESMVIEGFRLSETGERIQIHKEVGKESFVPHEDSYYRWVGESIKKELN